LSTITGTTILTPGEKASIIADYNALIAAKTGNDAQAVFVGISHTDYDSALTTLTTYLATLTSPVLWSDQSNYTTIDGTTFSNTFEAAYSAETSLLNAIAVKVNPITGLMPSQAGADVSGSINLVPDSNLNFGWEFWSNPGTAWSIVPGVGLNGANAFVVTSAASGHGQNAASMQFNLIAGQTYTLSAYLDQTNATTSSWGWIIAKPDLSAGYFGVAGVVGETGRYHQTFIMPGTPGALIPVVLAFETGAATLSGNLIASSPMIQVGSAMTAYVADTLAVAETGTQALANAATAQASANAAQSILNTITGTTILNPGQKPGIIADYNALVAAQAANDAQANLVAVSRTAYDAALSALTTYLGTLTTPVAWNVTTSYTTIDGTLFAAKFQAAYSAEKSLLNAIAAALTSAAVTGASINLVPDSNLNFGWEFWSTPGSAWSIGAGAGLNGANAFVVASAASGSSQFSKSSQFDLIAGQGYTLSAFIDASHATVHPPVWEVWDPTVSVSVYSELSQTVGQSGRVSTTFTMPGTAGTLVPVVLIFDVANATLSGNLIGSSPMVQAGSLTAYVADTIAIAETGTQALTNAATAQASANAAQGMLNTITGTSLLTPGEKASIIADYNALIAAQAANDAQATLLGISHAAYDNALSTLTSYLATLTSPVAWNVTTNYTTINGATFANNFEAAYGAETSLLNAIAGAINSTASSAVGGVLLQNPNFAAGNTGWALQSGWSITSSVAANYIGGSNYILVFQGTSTSGAYNNKLIPCAAGSLISVSNYMKAADAGCTGSLRIQIEFINGSGATIAGATAVSPNVTISDWLPYKAVGKAPVGAVAAKVSVAIFSPTTTDWWGVCGFNAFMLPSSLGDVPDGGGRYAGGEGAPDQTINHFQTFTSQFPLSDVSMPPSVFTPVMTITVDIASSSDIITIWGFIGAYAGTTGAFSLAIDGTSFGGTTGALVVGGSVTGLSAGTHTITIRFYNSGSGTGTQTQNTCFCMIQQLTGNSAGLNTAPTNGTVVLHPSFR
jgi:hypothetical protein